MGQFEYRLRVRLPCGRLLQEAPFLTPRARDLGDIIRLPVRPDGELQPGEGHDWRVAAVDDDGALVLEYAFPTAA